MAGHLGQPTTFKVITREIGLRSAEATLKTATRLRWRLQVTLAKILHKCRLIPRARGYHVPISFEGKELTREQLELVIRAPTPAQNLAILSKCHRTECWKPRNYLSTNPDGKQSLHCLLKTHSVANTVSKLWLTLGWSRWPVASVWSDTGLD